MAESQVGFCPHADWTCKPENVARTCSTFPPQGFCAALDRYPNATISDYGSISGQATYSLSGTSTYTSCSGLRVLLSQQPWPLNIAAPCGIRSKRRKPV